MSKIPQSPELDQTGMAKIAHSGRSASAPTEGQILVSPLPPKRGVKTRAKARSVATPPDARIAELERELERREAIRIYAERNVPPDMEALIVEMQRTKEALAHALTQADELRATIAQASQDSALLKRAETAEHQLESTRKWRDQLRSALDRASASAVDWQGKARAAQAQAEQNAQIAQEAHEERRALLEENTNLRAASAEQEENCQECAHLREERDHYKDLSSTYDGIIRRYQGEMDWQKRLRHNPELEPAHKLALLALREKTQGKGESYTRVYVEDLASEMGMKRQAAGRRLNELIEYGAFGSYRDTEKAVVPDKRLGQREIEKERINVVATALLERVEDLKRTDGKQHGGYGNRCKQCGAENALRHVFHTVCLACGHQDILMPEDAQTAILRAQAEAGVIEAETITAQARETAPAPAPIAQVVEEETAAPVVASDVQDEHHSANVQEAASWTEEDSLALTAAIWSDIEQKDPGCWVPEQVVAYWRKQGRIYKATKTRQEPPIIPDAQNTHDHTHKAVDFASRQIVEVHG